MANRRRARAEANSVLSTDKPRRLVGRRRGDAAGSERLDVGSCRPNSYAERRTDRNSLRPGRGDLRKDKYGPLRAKQAGKTRPVHKLETDCAHEGIEGCATASP